MEKWLVSLALTSHSLLVLCLFVFAFLSLSLSHYQCNKYHKFSNIVLLLQQFSTLFIVFLALSVIQYNIWIIKVIQVKFLDLTQCNAQIVRAIRNKVVGILYFRSKKIMKYSEVYLINRRSIIRNKPCYFKMATSYFWNWQING